MLQYSSTQTVSCYSAVRHTLHHLSVCTFPFPTPYSTVQHTLYNVTVQFNTRSVMLQYSSAHPLSSLSMYFSFPNTVQYSSTHIVSCYSTVQHTQCHVTVQFSTNCIICLYVLFLYQHCTVQFSTQCLISFMYCSFPNTVQYSITHTVSCYSTVQHTLCHVTVQFNTHSIMLQYSSTHTLSFYSTVLHTQFHVTV